MKAIYYNIFGLGHINPTLPLVRSLCEQGVEIFYHSSPERRNVIESTGATFVNYGYDSYKAADFNPGKNFVLQTIPATVGLLPFLQAEFEREKPDFIIYDSMAIWGHVIAQIYKVPSFCTVTTFALPIELKLQSFKNYGIEIDDKNIEGLSYLKLNYNIELSLHETLGAYGKHNIVFTAEKFNPFIESTPPLFYAGAMMEKRTNAFLFPLELIQNKNEKIITMALGTILLNEDPTAIEWFQELINAFGNDSNYRLILAVGNENNINSFHNIPTNVHIFSHIPQIEVLKYTDFFITHGGMNSINEALFYGVPLVVIPHSHDQFVNAQRVVDLNLGIKLNKNEISKETFQKSVYELTTNDEIQSNLQNLKDNFQSHTGLKGILAYINERVR